MSQASQKLPESRISDTQRLALTALLTGSTHAEAAKAAGVCRETVGVWVNHDDDFKAALDAERQEIVSSLRREIVSECRKSLRKLAEIRDRGEDESNQVRACARLLDLAPEDVASKAIAAVTQGPTTIIFEPAKVPENPA